MSCVSAFNSLFWRKNYFLNENVTHFTSEKCNWLWLRKCYYYPDQVKRLEEDLENAKETEEKLTGIYT